MTIKTKKSGFTIAEALMALLVISLITIASIPVITKKKRVIGTGVHGRWACTLNEQGQHMVFGSEQNPYGWIVSGDQCYFNPPRDARNFAVSAVGAGGGGAGSSMASELFTGTQSITVTKYGKYKMFAIGGGGQGGVTNCVIDNRRRTSQGAAGGFGYAEVDIGEDTKQIDIYVGKATEQGTWENRGATGEASYIRRYYNINSTQDLLVANGGEGGHPKIFRIQGCGNNDHNPTTAQGSVSWASSAKNTKNYNSGFGTGTTCKVNEFCYGTQSSDAVTAIKNIFGNNVLPNNSVTGRGGVATHQSSGGRGLDGAAGLIIETRFIGEGGKTSPSEIKRREFYPYLERLSVVIGKGGKGGDAGAAGSKGGTTYFGDMFSLEGGDGGKVINLETSNSSNKYTGENGEVGKLSLKGVTKTTALGGMASGNTSSANGQNATFYGSGGGGAGLNGSTSGKGGNGAPGYVLIEW